MGLPQFTVAVELTQMVCGSCGGTYAIAERLRDHHYEHGKSWHCPYCQTNWGYQKSQLELEQERHKQTLARLNEAAAERDTLQRKLRRVDKGVCPECKRTFSNLARHMACKHQPVTITASPSKRDAKGTTNRNTKRAGKRGKG